MEYRLDRVLLMFWSCFILGFVAGLFLGAGLTLLILQESLDR